MFKPLSYGASHTGNSTGPGIEGHSTGLAEGLNAWAHGPPHFDLEPDHADNSTSSLSSSGDSSASSVYLNPPETRRLRPNRTRSYAHRLDHQIDNPPNTFSYTGNQFLQYVTSLVHKSACFVK